MDTISREHRSWNMSRIKSKNTTPEQQVRSLLHKAGFRFRIHAQNLPGKPDIVLSKYRTVIFVHGCFWHRHPHCQRAAIPKTNIEYWNKKFERNVMRDKLVFEALEKSAWQVIIVWECELLKSPITVTENLISRLKIMELPNK